jgi:2-phosphosulfolactate phosphatase
MGMPKVSVCFTPELLQNPSHSGNSIVVVVDILRATTSMCAAFANGAAAIIPVAGDRDAIELSIVNCQLSIVDILVAGEKDGIKLTYADLGNSPLEFTREAVAGKTIVFSTTNGTKAILKAKEYGEVFIGSFLNIKALEAFLAKEKKDVIILCAGWKGQFSLEDTLFAGKLASALVEEHDLILEEDAARASIRLWQATGNRLHDFAALSSHYQRLLELESPEGLRYCFEPPEAKVLPKLVGERLIDWLIV